MRGSVFEGQAKSTETYSRWNNLAWACMLVCLAVPPRLGEATCRERPTVLLDERTAETHLLAKKDPELPANAPALARVRKVVLLVTVDREGVICEVKPVAGPQELRKSAVATVKKHWRYRPFLVDWKPVVAQFPVAVKFVLPKGEPHMTARRKDSGPAIGQGRGI